MTTWTSSAHQRARSRPPWKIRVDLPRRHRDPDCRLSSPSPQHQSVTYRPMQKIPEWADRWLSVRKGDESVTRRRPCSVFTVEAPRPSAGNTLPTQRRQHRGLREALPLERVEHTLPVGTNNAERTSAKTLEFHAEGPATQQEPHRRGGSQGARQQRTERVF
ncbi:hypothetical protein GN956_G5858 [Arapaima gigas]